MNRAAPDLKDLRARALIWQRNVNELIQAAWAHKGSIYDVWPVGGANDEHRLLAVHAIHLCQQLIQHAVSSTTSIALRGTALCGNGVQLVEEEDARGGLRIGGANVTSANKARLLMESERNPCAGPPGEPCQRSRVHWPRTRQTTWSAAQVP